MIRTLLFDLGNVLLHFSHERMYAQIGALCGKAPQEVSAMLAKTGLGKRFEQGRASEEEFHRSIEEFSGRSIPFDDLAHAASDIFWENETLTKKLPAFKRAGYRLVLLSNTCVPHIRFIRERFDVLAPFDDLVLSYEAGSTKPEPAIFETALKRIQCRPDECIYTDDIDEYVEMGRTMGLHAEVFTDSTRYLEAIGRLGVNVEP